MKIVLNAVWFLIVFVVLYIVYTIIKIKFFANNIQYSVGITGIDTSKIGNLLRLGSNESWAEVGYKIKLKNISDFSIELKNLEVEFYHDDLYIGKTEKKDVFKIEKESTSVLNGKAKLHFNKSALNMFTDMQNGKSVDLKYKVMFTVFMFPVTYWDTYKVGETEEGEAVEVKENKNITEKITSLL